MINNTKILKVLEKTDWGYSLTDLTILTKLSKDQVRISISFLLGAKLIEEYQIGMAKIYNLKKQNGK